MKKVLRVIGMFFAIVKVSAGTVELDQDPYLPNNIVASIQDISISKLLDYKKIASAIHDDFDKARFYYIIAYEIDIRLKELDEKFNSQQIEKVNKAISKIELLKPPFEIAVEGIKKFL